MLALIPTLTIFGNVLVVLAVLRERTLQTVTNYFIVSLAVADFLVALCVMPFAVYVEVSFAFFGSVFLLNARLSLILWLLQDRFACTVCV